MTGNSHQKASARRRHIFAMCSLGLVFLGYGSADAQQFGTATSPVQAAETRLPISINAVMVALTDRSAEPFWTASQKPPKGQQGWDELQYNAMQIALSGVVISFAGTGKFDASWVNQQEWQTRAKQLSAVGMRALDAAKTKDRAGIAKAGDDLVEVCEGCHRRFKPDMPSQGIIMHSEYYNPALRSNSQKSK